MICAYYDREADSRELFSSLKLAKADTGRKKHSWDKYIGKFDVVRIVMTDFFDSETSFDDALRDLQIIVCRDIKKKYPDVDYFNDKNLIQTLADAYSENDRQVVFVIDEWDAVFRNGITDEKEQTRYLVFLRNLLKDKSYIALTYMTGILPIKKYGKHSALNMFTEYSMMFPRQLARFTGFTESEVKELCNEYGRNYDEIKVWYDGYEVSDIIPPGPNHEELCTKGQSPKGKKYFIYSPLSVVEAVGTGVSMDYWNKTETYEALSDYIIKDYDGLKNMNQVQLRKCKQTSIVKYVL